MIKRLILVILFIPLLLAMLVSLALIPLSYILFSNGFSIFNFFEDLLIDIYD